MQTFNFIPDLKKIYDSSAKNQIYEAAQTVITLKQDYDFIGDIRIYLLDSKTL